jgi:hypothetical protein
MAYCINALCSTGGWCCGCVVGTRGHLLLRSFCAGCLNILRSTKQSLIYKGLHCLLATLNVSTFETVMALG